MRITVVTSIKRSRLPVAYIRLSVIQSTKVWKEGVCVLVCVGRRGDGGERGDKGRHGG